MTETTELTEQQRQQNTFNAVWQYSLTMTKQSLSANGQTCAYRGHKGNRCYIGALLPDELYKTAMESKDAARILANYEDVVAFFTAKGFSTSGDFLNAMQSIHDDCFNNRAKRLRNYAEQLGLTVPE